MTDIIYRIGCCNGCKKEYAYRDLWYCKELDKILCNSCKRILEMNSSNTSLTFDQLDDSLMINCDSCGKPVDITKSIQCSKCGTVLCSTCHEKHTCPPPVKGFSEKRKARNRVKLLIKGFKLLKSDKILTSSSYEKSKAEAIKREEARKKYAENSSILRNKQKEVNNNFGKKGDSKPVIIENPIEDSPKSEGGFTNYHNPQCVIKISSLRLYEIAKYPEMMTAEERHMLETDLSLRRQYDKNRDKIRRDGDLNNNYILRH